MEEEEDVSSPFWLQSTRQAGHRRRRSPSSFLFNSGALLVFLLAVAVAFIFIVIPSIQSFTSQIFKPHAVKRSWDSLNLVLVLFAIICGFLSRNHNNNESIATTPTTTGAAAGASYEDEEYKFDNRSESLPKSNPETPRRFWYDHAYNNNNNNNNNGGLSRLRSFSSHPDLRQEEALWANVEDQWRFYDDTHLYHNRFSSFDYKQQHQWLPQPQPQPQPKLEVLEEEKEKKENEEVDAVKNVDADNTTSSTVEESQKEIIYTPPQPPPASPSPDPAELPPSPSPSPPLPLPQTKAVRRRVKRTHQENGGNYRNNDLEVKPLPPPPQRQPPPLPAPPEPEIEESGGKSEKKRGATSATKEFLTSLRRKKKKKQRQKSVENLDSFFNYESSYPLPPSLIPPPSPPPPPPLPPPPPFFQNIFSSRKRKAKKIHSVIPSPPPPPPPPPTRTQKLSTSRTRNAQSTSQEPSLPVRVTSYSNVEPNVNSGNESPLNAIPPPPPLPPFKMPAWKFEVHGDFVRLKSNNIGADDVEESSCPSDSGDSPVATPLSCPSPDVNAKADNFIARFRAGLRLEKMNSVKEKEGRRRSNLGPEASPAQEGESPS